jgi:hypothetical protein
MSNPVASSMLLSAALTASLCSTRAQQAVAPAQQTAFDARQLWLVAHEKKEKPVFDIDPDDLAIADLRSPVRFDRLHLVDQHQAATQSLSSRMTI